jgi:hypothetical protein
MREKLLETIGKTLTVFLVTVHGLEETFRRRQYHQKAAV